ncbi:hypothetical protein C2845_PM14G08390 [Panicum miliaceum]|uniref:Uncharacterized protein n=1 Tax=Panicum miliaceum TaxID=4540 RepID=A0A3L6PS58_PANMI|nr:hypothetical protein C2845_PM14G08390 [Panicum miliaceum]
MVLFAAEEDDEFEFNPGEPLEKTETQRWLAIARFYSGQNFKAKGLFDEMKVAWGWKDLIPPRSLGDNRFLLEFDTERRFNYVINGGPWKHKGDAMIVVPYDGRRRPSEVIIESLALWVRFYDITVYLASNAFVRVLG